MPATVEIDQRWLEFAWIMLPEQFPAPQSNGFADALAQLTRRQRQVLYLHCSLKLTYADVAAVLGLSRRSCERYALDARERLRQCLPTL